MQGNSRLPGTLSAERVTVSPTTRLRAGQSVLLRVAFQASDAEVVLDALVESAQEAGGHWSARLSLALEAVAIIERGLAAERGEGERIARRQTRYRVSMPAVVTCSVGVVYMQTTSVSADGCGLMWSGRYLLQAPASSSDSGAAPVPWPSGP